MRREWTLSRVARKGLWCGFWDDRNHEAMKLVASLKMLYEQDIVMDLEWVEYTLSDTLKEKRGQWVVRRDVTNDLVGCILGGEYDDVCTGCAHHVSPY